MHGSGCAVPRPRPPLALPPPFPLTRDRGAGILVLRGSVVEHGLVDFLFSLPRHVDVLVHCLGRNHLDYRYRLRLPDAVAPVLYMQHYNVYSSSRGPPLRRYPYLTPYPHERRSTSPDATGKLHS